MYEVFAGGGEMGDRMKEYDWTQTALGSPLEWPQSLKTSVNIILNSQHPMWIGWGPELIFLYNDAYIPVLGLAKHPFALGEPAKKVWAEIWDICGPLAEKVMQKAESTFTDNTQLFMKRGDYLEEVYYSFSYSPIRDEAGEVKGLFCPSASTTEKLLSERRLKTLRELSSKILLEKTIESSCMSAMEILGMNPQDIPFALLYLVNPVKQCASLVQSIAIPKNEAFIAPAHLDLGKQDLLQSCWPIAEVFESGQGQLISVTHLNSLPRGLANQPISKSLILPLNLPRHNNPIGFLIMGINPCRKLDNEYRTFCDLIAGQVASAIQNAKAYETEKERAEMLADLDRAKTTFFSNISHEFRTPLTLMLGPIEGMLVSAKKDISTPRQEIEILHRNSLRLLKLVNTLLDFSRIEADRMQASYSPTNLAKLTLDLASAFRSAIEYAGMRLILDCPELSQDIFVDRDMWEKIVLNLLSNAFKYTLKGEIRVTLREVDSNVELCVQDTGIGISAENIPHLFERFYRVEGAQGRTHEGSGIGLALIYELIKLHGGNICVKSVYSEGSIFKVSIPIGFSHLPPEQITYHSLKASTSTKAQTYIDEILRWPSNQPNEMQTEEQASHPITERERPNIVLADDNRDMREYIIRLLKPYYNIIPVGNGREVIKVIHRQKVDLILSDIMMPVLDGFGMLKELRADSLIETIPVILLSARAGEESRIEGLNVGADDYLIKPFSSKELVTRVRTHLEMANLRKKAFKREMELLAEKEMISEKLNLALNAAHIGTWTWMIPNNHFYIDKRLENLLGISDNKINNYENFIEMILLSERKRFRELTKQSVEKQTPFIIECQVLKVDKTMRVLVFQGQCFYDKNGKAERMTGVCMDITQKKEIEFRLHKQQIQISTMSKIFSVSETATTIAHQLNQPLAAIHTYAELGIANIKDNNIKQLGNYLDQISKESLRIGKTIHQIKNFVNKKDLFYQPIDINKLIHETIEHISYLKLVCLSNIKLILSPVLPIASVDKIQIQQVMINLLVNAIEAVQSIEKSNQRIIIETVFKEPHLIEIYIKNNGSFIPRFLHKKIFEPYFSTKANGFGIGLSICQTILEAHGGRLGLRYSNKTKGTCFNLMFNIKT